MNEKRRGRPPKARIEGADVVDEQEQEPSCDPRAQAYALRVWFGQSDTVPRSERIERVKRALAGQNLPFEGVQLP